MTMIMIMTIENSQELIIDLCYFRSRNSFELKDTFFLLKKIYIKEKFIRSTENVLKENMKIKYKENFSLG